MATHSIILAWRIPWREDPGLLSRPCRKRRPSAREDGGIKFHEASAVLSRSTVDCIALQAPLSIGILQARILEWVAISSSTGSSRPRDRTHVSYISCIGRRALYSPTTAPLAETCPP